ncbi:L-rhamnose mutarotase [Agromyces intestinalis]|uniref:L-rhamnose mutarotase n=1 Tax=Agromyces intestinalis TaxID=2592652 RepID=A0A5C1YIJ4_9MICO|nr:L-rhamnose mutarotase [Agromyces intestinalis]QEO14602.1 L-rhamnose mutarotase [Agromyces intestinalis]
MTSTERIALHSEVRDGYVEAHVRIPDDLAEAFPRVGIHEWTIWRSGNHMFHLVACDDWDAAVTALDDEPANVDWQATIGPFVEVYRDASGDPGFEPLDIVWDLRAQRAEGL